MKRGCDGASRHTDAPDPVQGRQVFRLESLNTCRPYCLSLECFIAAASGFWFQAAKSNFARFREPKMSGAPAQDGGGADSVLSLFFFFFVFGCDIGPASAWIGYGSYWRSMFDVTESLLQQTLAAGFRLAYATRQGSTINVPLVVTKVYQHGCRSKTQNALNQS